MFTVKVTANVQDFNKWSGDDTVFTAEPFVTKTCYGDAYFQGQGHSEGSSCNQM